MCNCPPFKTVDYVGGGGSDEEMDDISGGLLLISSFADGNKYELSLTKNLY